MVRRPTKSTCLTLLLLTSVGGVRAPAAELGPLPDGVDAAEAMADTQIEMTLPPPELGSGSVSPSHHWLDRTQAGLHEAVWRSAMHVDRWFGSHESEAEYQHASGSIAPALLWDEFEGFQPQLRFRVNLPMPRLNERFQAFFGRVNPDEYVTERAQQSGAFRRQYGPAEEDETLFGIQYRDPPEPGWRFDAGAGVRVRFPLDPYVKAGYRYERGSLEHLMLGLRATAFWQNSEGAGLTSRIDVERLFGLSWLLRWTASGTFSEASEGVRGYTTLTLLRGLPNHRAVAAEVFMEGEFDALVPLGDYGGKLAYRHSVIRDWLILEVRTSVTWPKDFPDQPRKPSWGVGIGFEMYFGDADFLARPTTF